MRVTFCVPYRGGDDEYRDRNWKCVRQWLDTHHSGWPIVMGTDTGEPFNPARARNDAAKKAGDWDVAVFVDSDTLVHPETMREAVQLAADTDQMVIAGNAKIYMDAGSTQLFLDTGLMFPTPTDWPDTRRQRFTFDDKSVYRDPCSGVVVVSRPVWEATGGYLHNADPNDSYEDLIFFACCEIFAGLTRTPGMQLHLWHPAAQRYRGANHRTYQRLQQIKRRPHAQQLARDYLTELGHKV